jgi:hypothetical protein
MATPLFILGKHRSGTTFLSNLLMDHSQIAAVYWPGEKDGIAGGIFESGYFEYIDRRYGDLQNIQNFIEFASVLSQSEYFKLAASSMEEILDLYPADYADVFKHIMDRYAQLNGAVYWMEKTPNHTLKTATLKQVYPDAKFIGIIRDEVDSGISSLHLKEKQNRSKSQRAFFLTYFTFRKSLFDKTLRKLEKAFPGDVIVLSYESLIDNTNDQITRICRFLKIEETPLQSKFRKNTSFKSDADKRIYRHERVLIRLLYRVILRWMPLCILAAADRFLRRDKRPPLPRWFFRSNRQFISNTKRKNP